jgi:hypothetical protein
MHLMGAVNHNPKCIDGLDISSVDGGFIIYEPEKDRVHFLNHTAVLVLELCNGRNSPAEIAELMKGAYGLPEAPHSAVHEILGKMRDEGLLAQACE